MVFTCTSDPNMTASDHNQFNAQNKKHFALAFMLAIMLGTVLQSFAATGTHLFLSSSVPRGSVGTSYNFALRVTGGVTPYMFRVTRGNLPSGLSLDTNQGIISGVPTSAGTVNFVVSVSDANNDVGDKSLELEIGLGEPNSPTITITPSTSTVMSGTKQLFVATVTNTPNTGVSWTSSSGSVIAGLFTAPSVSTTTTVTLTATLTAAPTIRSSALAIVTPAVGPMPLTITTSSLPSVLSGLAYRASLAASGGTPPYSWSLASGALPSGIQLGQSGNLLGTTTQSGNFPITVRLADSIGQSTTQLLLLAVIVNNPPPQGAADNRYCTPGNSTTFGAQSDGVATLPINCFYTALWATPSPGSTIQVPAGASLQGAISSANCGDTLLLQAGASFTGTFTLPDKGCDNQHWITIRTSASNASLPPEGSRITPCYAGLASLSGRPAYSCSSTVDQMPRILAGGNFAFTTGTTGGNHYRLIGLEITHSAGMPVGQPDTLVSVSGPVSPHHIIIDRCWIHGTAVDFLKRGVKLDGSYLAVVDSTVTDVHALNTATQGILSGTGTGPLKIVNNFVEGGDSAIGFGGQGNPLGNPADIEIRRNHLFKPWAWRRYADPSYLGYPFSAKTALESKNSDRVLIEGNIMENTWGGHPGRAISGRGWINRVAWPQKPK